MMTKSQLKNLVMVAGFVFFVSGCTAGDQSGATTRPGLPPKESLEGVIIEAGAKKIIDVDGRQVEIESRKVDLDIYVGKEVSVTGGYSGTTLYVETVKEK
jgi:hypothetical protein